MTRSESRAIKSFILAIIMMVIGLTYILGVATYTGAGYLTPTIPNTIFMIILTFPGWVVFVWGGIKAVSSTNTR